MSIPLLLIVAGTAIAVTAHVSIYVQEARCERRRLQELEREGRTVEWEEIQPRLANGTILIDDQSSCMGTPPPCPSLLLWWLERDVSFEEERTVDVYVDTSWKAIIGAPRWARKVRTLKRRFPETTVYARRLISQFGYDG